jgi:glycosyltransferase involved in cell wall biosynthesis
LNKIDVSIVVPMMNEESCLEQLFDRLHSTMAQIDCEYEIVCINDGSTDQTLSLLLDRRNFDKRLIVIDLSRNFGKEAALTAGLHHARGACAIPIDADLQDPPALIGQMIEKWRQGYEVVTAVRVARDTDSMAKRSTAGGFYWLMSKISDIEIIANAGDYRLLDRKVVDAIRQLPERSRFNKGLFAWVGFRQCAVEYSRPERHAGKTKFRYWRLWNFALDGITSFSTSPLRIWSYIGMCIALLALFYAAYLVGRTVLLGNPVPGYASIMVAILFFSGLNMLSLGVVAEYIARIFVETKQRPLYIVREIHGGPGDTPPAGETAS